MPPRSVNVAEFPAINRCGIVFGEKIGCRTDGTEAVGEGCLPWIPSIHTLCDWQHELTLN